MSIIDTRIKNNSDNELLIEYGRTVAIIDRQSNTICDTLISIVNDQYTRDKHRLLRLSSLVGDLYFRKYVVEKCKLELETRSLKYTDYCWSYFENRISFPFYITDRNNDWYKSTEYFTKVQSKNFLLMERKELISEKYHLTQIRRLLLIMSNHFSNRRCFCSSEENDKIQSIENLRKHIKKCSELNNTICDIIRSKNKLKRESNKNTIFECDIIIE